MTQADKGLRGLMRIAEDPPNPYDTKTDEVSPERLDRYRLLLRSVGLHHGFDANESGAEVDFPHFADGSVLTDDVEKGYAYLTLPPKQVLSSLDEWPPDEKVSQTAYRHIQGCWYLYGRYIPDIE